MIRIAPPWSSLPRHWSLSSPPKRAIDSRSAIETKSSNTLFMSNTNAVAASLAPWRIDRGGAQDQHAETQCRSVSLVEPGESGDLDLARAGTAA